MSEQKTLCPARVPSFGFARPYRRSPASFVARCSAAVPADRPTAYCTPMISAMAFSASSMFRPTVLTQLVAMASSTKRCSSPCMVGEESHTRFAKGSRPRNRGSVFISIKRSSPLLRCLPCAAVPILHSPHKPQEKLFSGKSGHPGFHPLPPAPAGPSMLLPRP